MLERPSSLDCPPRWGTPRSPHRPTMGDRVAAVAELLGTPLMPWQRHVVDVALEIDDTGQLAYREVVLTVPRQSGKTTLLLAVMVHRALGFGARQNIIYTAQARIDALAKFRDEHLPILEQSQLKTLFRTRKTTGSEAILWKNRSIHSIAAPTEKAGHGQTLDLGVIDEAFAQDDDRLEQAFKPAMITRPQPQLWIPSTAGTEKSVYLRGKVDAGRDRVKAGITHSVAYFEWSAPEDADPADLATWYACMPALGHTVRETAIRADFESMKLREFRRAYLNQWPDAAPDEWLVIPREAWMALVDPKSRPVDPVAFAVDVNPERSAAAIGVAGRRADGLVHGEVVDHRPGTGWVVDRVVELKKKWRPCAVVVDAAGQAGSLIASLEAAGIEVVKPTAREAAQAYGAFYDGVMGEEPAWRHLNQAPLNAALAGAQKRDLADAWALARRASSVDISPLVAVVNAAWGHATRAHVTDQVVLEGPLGA